jgi:hypothetical protein
MTPAWPRNRPSERNCRALGALFGGAVSKDIVSRVWRKVKSDWQAWNARSLVEEPIVRLNLDGFHSCPSSKPIPVETVLSWWQPSLEVK